MDGQGNALAVWAFFDGVRIRVQAAFRPAGGVFGAPQIISPLPAPGTIEDNGQPQVAFDGQGNALAVWVANRQEAGTAIKAAFRPAGGSFGAPTELGLVGSYNSVSMDMDQQGDAVVVWDRFNGQGYDVFARVRPAGGSFEPTAPLSPPGSDAQSPQVAMGGGAASAVWRQLDGADYRIQAAHRPAGGGFGAPQPLSEPGQDADRPQVAMDEPGNAIATWERPDGENTRVQSILGLAPGVSPPPIPPPPIPPPTVTEPPPGVAAVTAIRAAAPFRRSRAVVLTAEVAGPVERLEWNLPVGPDVVGRTVDGRLQRSVRFRPDPGAFRVRVRAVGPDGAGSPFARGFTMPRALAGADVARVTNALDGRPAVNAVGDAPLLLGRSGPCDLPTSVKSGELDFAGCFAPAETLADIPRSERGILDVLARELSLPAGDASLIRTAVELSDGYVARDRVTLEGGWPIVPGGDASIVAFPQAKALASSDAGLQIGGHRFGRPGGFVLEIDPRRHSVPLPALPRPSSLPSLGGFRLVGDFDVRLVGDEAHISSSLQLPSFLKRAGVDIRAAVRLRATPDRLIVDDMTIGPIDVNIGVLAVNQFRIAYRGASEEWQGQGRACLISGLCLDMIPPNGQVKIRDGRLDFAGASLGFPPPGVPLFAGINLERIGFGFGLDPTRLTGNALIGAARILKIDGRLVLAFPTVQTPFILRRDEVGDGFPSHLYDRPRTGVTIGMSADASIQLPVIGAKRLGNAHFLYEHPGYVAFGGAFSQDFAGIVLIRGGVAGELNVVEGLFNLHGNVDGCLQVVRPVCAGAVANVSRGRGGTGGAGACLRLGPVQVGGGVQWQRVTRPFIWPFDGCKWSRFTAQVRGARAAQTQPGSPYVVNISAGDRSRAIQLDGAGAAPLVRVLAPDGRTLETAPDSGLTTTDDGAIRILRFESEAANFTVVGLQNPQPGAYQIEPLPGSATIGQISQATDPAKARIRARVSRRGTHRELEYQIGERPDQTVTFLDTAPDGAARRIGTVSGGGQGRLRFVPAPGRGTRTIRARFELNGLPAEERVVARYTPPSPQLARPRQLRVRRQRTRLRISWARVSGAARYEVAVTLSTGRQRFATTRRRTVVAGPVSRASAGSVSVRAVAKLRQGLPARTRFRATARRRTALRRLPRVATAGGCGCNRAYEQEAP